MNRFVLVSFVLVALLALSGEASLAQQRVKEGSTVEIDAFKGAKAIKRTVPAGEQVFHLDGALKGTLVDAKGKKVESTNYEAKNGVLVIKKFSKADVGSYSEHPTKVITTKTASGTGAVLGLTLNISLE